MANRSWTLSELLEAARPSITANGPDPQGRRGYCRGFAGLFGDLKSDEHEFQSRMIASGAAQFDLDHVWWPKHREAVLKLVESARAVQDDAWNDEEGYISPDHWNALSAALTELDSSNRTEHNEVRPENAPQYERD